MPDFSDGTLLGGKIRYRQPRHGYRTGIEPVLLAASVPARTGQLVLECGTGAGAGLLALAARVPGLRGTGLERDPALAELASANLADNGFCGIEVLRQDVEAWNPALPYDHAFANPPWHRDDGTQSDNPGRRDAKSAPPDLLLRWTVAMAACLRRRGTLSLVLPAALMGAAIHALVQAGCAETTLMPLWPHTAQAAKLILVRGVKQGRGACRVLPGLMLHEAGGGYTTAADAIFRHGGRIEM